MKFVTKRIHAFLDYPVAIALIVLPFLLSLGSSNPLALQLSVATGIATIGTPLLKDSKVVFIPACVMVRVAFCNSSN